MTSYERIQQALAFIPAHDRDVWVRVGMAIKSEVGEDGFPLWDTWSQTADNYNAKDAKAVWRSIKVNGGVSIGSLFHEAKGHGWRPGHPFQGPTPKELEQRRTQGEAEEHKRQAEEARKHELARKRAKAIWEGASFAPDDHPYLVRKGVKSHGLKFYRGELVIDGMLCDGALLVPIRNSEGVLHSMEFISPAGEKRFLPGGKKTGGFFLIGTSGAVLGITEGYATAASLHEAAGYAVAMAFDCGNLLVVAKALGEKYPDSSLFICGDRGQGEAQAREAARAVNARLALPDFSGLNVTERGTDFNDLHQLAGLEAVKVQFRQAKTLIEEAKSVIEALDPKDPGAWFEDKTLEALVLLYDKSKPDYERAISQARRAKASIKALKSAVAERSKGKARQGETPNVTFEMLDTEPLTMRRPLALLGGKSYAAIWPIVQSTIAESVNDKGEAVKHDPPIVHTAHSLMVVSGDGDVFGIGNLPISKLNITVHLPWAILPDKAWSVPGVKSYRNGRSPEPSDVFNRATDIVDRFIDFNLSLADQKTMSEMVGCYVLGTWFLDAFKVIGYLWPNGDPGSGKSQLQAVISEISYLGQLILSGGSYPCLRDMADYGATLGFDDAEGLTDPKRTDPDKRALLLAGNRKGNTIRDCSGVPGVNLPPGDV